MRKLLALLLVPALAGCLTASKAPEPVTWTVGAGPVARRAETPSFGVTRLSQVNVRAPYDVPSLAVLRADATLAFDSYNRFAALPSHLLKGAAQDVLAASGRFAAVVPSTSSASATHVAELTVTAFRLDCSSETRTAETGVSLLILDGRRTIVASACGDGRADATDGDYGSAFAKAFAQAVEKALGTL